jgi:hypothetical protein
MISELGRALCLSVLCYGIAVPVHAGTNTKREAKRSLPPPTHTSAPAIPPVPAAATPTAEQIRPEPPPANPIEMRARIRSCAVQWRAMKAGGTDLGMTWGDFSEDCLAKN